MAPVDTRIHDRFERLYTALYQKVFRFCYRVTQDFEDAMAVCEWTWAEALRRIAADQEPEGESDLIRIASGQCIHYMKSLDRQAFQRAAETDPDEIILDKLNWETAEVGELVQQAHADASLRKVMATLSPKQRTALVLKYHYGAKTVDVARMLSVGFGTAKTHLRCGLLMAAKLGGESHP